MTELSFHQQLLQEIKKVSKNKTPTVTDSNYSGSTHPSWGINVPQTKEIVTTWVKNHKDLTLSELTDLLDSLYIYGFSKEEKKLPGYLLYRLPKFRQEFDPWLLDKWIGNLIGWEEIDSVCQGIFMAGDMDQKWEVWEKLLTDFSKSSNISKRRASLVLLTSPVWKSPDDKFVELAFENIDRLKHEKDILITKAISWLLRSMFQHHKDSLRKYLATNEASLPKIAVREAKRKLETGRK